MEDQENKCQSVTEVYSRVVGFYRPVSCCNDGKKQEIVDRVVYKIDSEDILKESLENKFQ